MKFWLKSKFRYVAVTLVAFLLTAGITHAVGMFYYDSVEGTFVFGSSLRVLGPGNFDLTLTELNTPGFYDMKINSQKNLELSFGKNGSSGYRFGINTNLNRRVFELSDAGGLKFGANLNTGAQFEITNSGDMAKVGSITSTGLVSGTTLSVTGDSSLAAITAGSSTIRTLNAGSSTLRGISIPAGGELKITGGTSKLLISELCFPDATPGNCKAGWLTDFATTTHTHSITYDYSATSKTNCADDGSCNQSSNTIEKIRVGDAECPVGYYIQGFQIWEAETGQQVGHHLIRCRKVPSTTSQPK